MRHLMRDCRIVYAQKKFVFFPTPPKLERSRVEEGFEQEIEFSNHENNWFKSERMCLTEDVRARRSFSLFYRRLCCVKTAQSQGNLEIKRYFGGWCFELRLPKHCILLFFIPVEGNSEGNSQFDVKESSFFHWIIIEYNRFEKWENR